MVSIIKLVREFGHKNVTEFPNLHINIFNGKLKEENHHKIVNDCKFKMFWPLISFAFQSRLSSIFLNCGNNGNLFLFFTGSC